ncbi:MAG: tRNA (adenosine(37)-N6)-dimethylallyltransferase MiaA [Candidatus Peribacteraceae bacterium]|jgi:tRNA dimethylallyltransferase|nr:tRNA (adenosine(37)-N6)-dimethylallyltransferase MiaA [Candidatus Peribacteraceae bacterium]MDP7477230.1 tRNA (adenosine(37)-N6)-dimethylallyltransferase MiaA [Candidatus Peribacteraceae bacterium]
MTTDNTTWHRLTKDHIESSASPLIVILGPTASGKTTFSVELAKWLKQEFKKDTEVINADSRQLFRNMDIGTAKVSEEEMQEVPHHLLDVLDPNDEINVAWYKDKAEAAADDILRRGNIPLLVGGSMLYIASVTDGLTFDESVRSELRSPEASCKYDLLVLGLGKDRSEIINRINVRTEKLFESGWIYEVKSLVDQGYTKTDPGIKACGYREIIDFLNLDTSDEDKLRESIAAKTRQYARRQMTWWKGDTRIHWL